MTYGTQLYGPRIYLAGFKIGQNIEILIGYFFAYAVRLKFFHICILSNLVRQMDRGRDFKADIFQICVRNPPSESLLVRVRRDQSASSEVKEAVATARVYSFYKPVAWRVGARPLCKINRNIVYLTIAGGGATDENIISGSATSHFEYIGLTGLR